MADHIFITGQFVRIGQKLANANSRVSAFLIDIIVIFFLVSFGNILISLLMLLFHGYQDLHTVVEYTFLTIVLAYPLWMEWMFKGQTIGKMCMGIRVVDADGSTPSFLNLLFRWVFFIVEGFSGFGLVVMLFTNNNQRLGDLAGGTFVVKTGKAFFGRSYRTEDFPPDYRPMFPQASMLSEGQIELISQTYYLRGSEADNIRVQLCQKICQFLNINVSGMSPFQLLNQLHYDYRFLTVHADA